ncbi:hypothetical protein QVD17_03489 [Tagetes erecta]|uniref:Uncharacterized protein n=1 Tax=Tagetes erecta TaxID=13708 RepID=A0AAD8LDN1_TARER|nr:hypothetical protein QVD17_03489 [Tagetes erecta]
MLGAETVKGFVFGLKELKRPNFRAQNRNLLKIKPKPKPKLKPINPIPPFLFFFFFPVDSRHNTTTQCFPAASEFRPCFDAYCRSAAACCCGADQLATAARLLQLESRQFERVGLGLLLTLLRRTKFFSS